MGQDIALDAPRPEVAPLADPGHGHVDRVELERFTVGIHQRPEGVRDVNSAVDMQDLVGQYPALDRPRFEADQEIATEETGLSQFPAPPLSERRDLGKRRNQSMGREAARRLSKRRINPGQRLFTRGFEAPKRDRDESRVEKRVEGHGDSSPQETESILPSRFRTNRLIGIDVNRQPAPFRPLRILGRQFSKRVSARPAIDVGKPHRFRQPALRLGLGPRSPGGVGPLDQGSRIKGVGHRPVEPPVAFGYTRRRGGARRRFEAPGQVVPEWIGTQRAVENPPGFFETPRPFLDLGVDEREIGIGGTAGGEGGLDLEAGRLDVSPSERHFRQPPPAFHGPGVELENAPKALLRQVEIPVLQGSTGQAEEIANQFRTRPRRSLNPEIAASGRLGGLRQGARQHRHGERQANKPSPEANRAHAPVRAGGFDQCCTRRPSVLAHGASLAILPGKIADSDPPPIPACTHDRRAPLLQVVREDHSATPSDPGDFSGNDLANRVTPLLPWLGPLLVFGVGAVVLWWSWPHGPDSLIDFGRELYVPWQIAQGTALYGEILYLNGPLSPHWNALLFASFGEGLRVLMIANVAVATAITILLYGLIQRAADRLAATVAGLAFVSFIAFTQLGSMGNYNFLTPYSHEMTHGLLLCLLALWAFSSLPRTGDRGIALAGFLLGGVFLTKPELFVAIAAALVLGVALAPMASPRPLGRSLRGLGLLAVAGMAPVAIAFLLLWTQLPAQTAWGGILDPWISILNENVTDLEFYRWVRGTDQLEINLSRMALWLSRYATFVVPAAVLCFLAPRRQPWRNVGAVAVFVLLFLLLGPGPYIDFLAGNEAPARDLRINEWPHATRGFPVALGVIGAAAFIAWLRDLRKGEDTFVAVFRLVWIAFALGLLAKIIFNVRLHHYGFALALPGLVVFTSGLVCWIPRLIDHWGGSGVIFRAASLALLATATVDAFQIIELQYANSRHVVGTGVDRFQSGAKAQMVARVLRDLEERVEPHETLAVLPEGIMINYLARIDAPTSHTNFMPPEVILYGEDRILSDFLRSPPDYVVVVHKDTTEYGFPLFGQDYGRDLHAWVLENYEPVRLFGNRPLRDVRRFGIEIRKRIGRETQSESTGG